MALMKEAGIVDIGPGEGLLIKASVSITWSKTRLLRRYIIDSCMGILAHLEFLYQVVS